MASADPSDPFYPLAISTPFSSSSQPFRVKREDHQGRKTTGTEFRNDLHD